MIGNFFRFANVHQRDRTYIVRQARIKREGSPYYTYSVGVIAAGGSVVLIPRDYFPGSKKYEPLDYVEVVNNDVVDLSICVNGEDTFVSPAGTIRSIEGQPLHQLRITNTDAAAATTSGKTILTLQRQPLTIDKWARMQK
jgi:hypothetical protein